VQFNRCYRIGPTKAFSFLNSITAIAGNAVTDVGHVELLTEADEVADSDFLKRLDDLDLAAVFSLWR
jgi:hypothetical protein